MRLGYPRPADRRHSRGTPLAMRTTLKRGVGRSAAANGNGNGYAVLPPGPLAPMVTYEQPPHRRSYIRVLGKVLFLLVALAVMVATAAAAGSYLYTEDTVAQLAPPKTVETKKVRKALAIAAPG